MKKSLYGFLFTFFLLIGCAVEQSTYQATSGSTLEALAKGKGKEVLSAMEAQAFEAEKNKNWDQAASAYNEATWAAQSSGQLQKAISYASKALDLAQKAGNREHEVRATYFLALVHNSLGQHIKAKEWTEKGIEVTKPLPPGLFKQAYQGMFYRLLGQDFLRRGELQKAIEHLSYSVQVQEDRLTFFRRRSAYLPPATIPTAEHLVLTSLSGLGTAHRRAGNVEEAIKTYEKGIDLIKNSRLKTTAEGGLYQGLGQAYLAKKDYPRALENLQKALQMAEGRQQASAMQNASTQIGNLYLQTQKPSEAIPYFQKAIHQIESTRSLLQSEEFRQSYFEGALNAYTRMMDALLSAGKQEDAFNYSERARSRVFLDLLGSRVQLSRLKGGLLEEERTLQERIAALKVRLAGEGAETGTEREGLRKELTEAEQAYTDFLAKVRKENKEQASLMNVEPLTLKQTQELLDPGVTMLEYFVTPQQVLLWIVEKDKVEFVQAAIDRKELLSKVGSFRQGVFQLEEIERVRAAAQELYRLLIDPALPHIRGKELIIVPHDTLHYVPFHALLSPQGRYLVENYPIHYLSSASLMQFTQEKRKAKGELSSVLAQAGKVLALGNPDLGDPAMSLRFAELEAREVQRLYPQSTVLLKKEATEDKAKELSPQNDIVHFASHAELSEGDPLASAILLAEGGKEDGRLEVREIFGLDLKASLVVLSACETGLGKLSSGDELVGLTRAFIYAGTPSVMASLWKVEDSSTATLMANFYKNLKTMTKVEALRQAQLGLINEQASSDLLVRRGIGGIGKLGEIQQTKSESASSVPVSVSTSHPYFWAPFILVGEGK